jgi:lipopolysaccharide transport system ATP-binding protein
LLCQSTRLWTLATRHQSPVTPEASLRDGEFFAVKDVSFELRRGELRTPGRSEKEISKKCLAATKVPDSGRRRHQCLGLIGHNGAGKTTLLKMLNGLIKPDRGRITMRGRVGALIALGAGFNPILTGREPKGWEARRTSNRRLARRVQRRREGANQNIYINGSVLGLTKKKIDAKIDEIIDFADVREAIDMPV